MSKKIKPTDITATIKECKRGFLHQVFLNGNLIGKRLSNRTFRAAWVVQKNAEALIAHYSEQLERFKDVEASANWYLEQIEKLRKNGSPVEVVNYTNYPESINRMQSHAALRDLDVIVHFLRPPVTVS